MFYVVVYYTARQEVMIDPSRTETLSLISKLNGMYLYKQDKNTFTYTSARLKNGIALFLAIHYIKNITYNNCFTWYLHEALCIKYLEHHHLSLIVILKTVYFLKLKITYNIELQLEWICVSVPILP